MAEYHVGVKKETGVILGGTKTSTGKWKNSSDVTEEAMSAVRDHLLYKMITENKPVYYAWQYQNGKTIILKLEEVDTEKIKNEAENPEST